MATLATYYYIQDEYSDSGAQLSPDFSAPSLASAQAVAQIYATLFQRNVRLVPKTGTPPYTPLFTANATSLALSTAPSGITF